MNKNHSLYRLIFHIIYLTAFLLILSNCDTNLKKEETTAPRIDSVKLAIYEKVRSENIIDENFKRTGKWTLFFDKKWNSTTSINEIEYYRICNYKNDEIDGKYSDFRIDGSKQFEGFFTTISGKQIFDGKCIWYDAYGNPEREVNYKNGKKHGKELIYFAKGGINQKSNFKDGKLHGTVTKYYDIDKIKFKQKYRNEKLHGTSSFYYDNGQLQKTISYYNGQTNGKVKEYYKSGKPKLIGKYVKGEQRGTLTYYDEDGDYRRYQFKQHRIGAICRDGTRSYSTGRGTCSWHGGVAYWLYDYRKVLVSATGKYK